MDRPRSQRGFRRHPVHAIARGRLRLLEDGSQLAGTALLAAWLTALLTIATAGLAALSALQFGPPVGQILTFGPYAQPGPVWHIAATAGADQRHCILQPAVMALAPGSLVVEARSADGRRFQAHWIGGPTRQPRTDCGTDVDLTLALPAIQTLVNADSLAHQHWAFSPP